MGETPTPSNSSNQPSIDDLLNGTDGLYGMKQLTKYGAGEDFRLSATASENYLKVIRTFRKSVNHHLKQATSLADRAKNYGHPGSFISAHTTLSHLVDALTDANNGLVPNLAGYIKYIDELEKTVKAAHSRFQAEDNS